MKKQYLGWFTACLILLSGCSLNLVGPYDPQTTAQLQTIDRKIEYMYLSMHALEESQRHYDRFAKQYLDLDIDIRALERRQERRESNKETLQQVQILAQLWQQDRKIHQQQDGLSDFMIKRRQEQYLRLIDTIMRGELAKQ
ncbi:hypothetical protein [Kistimonas asteriae]|uniref:hypothetical protein n=1 Tax=Kistimonas asteriae TaxID=517724 RepID=UPI001BAD6576|nr:hypothetical protein [Kistimonas asteriae]